MPQEQRLERFQDIAGSHPCPDGHRQSLSRELIQNRQHLIAASVAELVVYEVDGPDMVGMRRPQADN